ncbi:MAG: hypothetical protein HQ567_25685 [Candidatus Nealsonbacteria bacterium]|nr:hypothetical protein [Candidatus Nealsonbacteria bacterium]
MSDGSFPPISTYSDPVPPRRGRSAAFWLWVLIPACLLVAVLLVVGLGAAFVLTATEEEVTAEDRQLIVDAQTLAECMEDFTADPQNETITKTRYFDRSYDIEYEYDDPSDDYEPYLYFCVTVERNSSDALTSYVAAWQTSKLGMAWGSDAEVKVVECNDLFRWGDQSKFAILKVDGEPAGNLFAARRGNLVVDLILGGVYFDDAETFSSLMSSALENIEDSGRCE